MRPPRSKQPLDPERVKQLQEQLKKIEQREARAVKWHWSLTFAVAGGIVGAIISSLIYSFTMMSYGGYALIVLGSGLIGFIAQWKYFYSPAFIQKYFRIHILAYGLYNFAGIGFTCSALFFTLNWLGASSEKEIERHKIVGTDRNYISDDWVVLLLENDAYENDPYMRAVPYSDGKRRKTYPYLDIEYSQGLFGFKIYHEHHVSSGTTPASNE